MNNIWLMIPLLLPMTALTADAKPLEYTIPVHVQKSWLVPFYWHDLYIYRQHLSVLIEGRKYELEDEKDRSIPLRIGDYKARTLKTGSIRPYEDLRVYELLFPDGQTRRYALVGEEE